MVIARKGAADGRKTAVPFGPFLALRRHRRRCFVGDGAHGRVPRAASSRRTSAGPQVAACDGVRRPGRSDSVRTADRPSDGDRCRTSRGGRSSERPPWHSAPRPLVGLDIEPGGIAAVQVPPSTAASPSSAPLSPTSSPASCATARSSTPRPSTAALRALCRENKGLDRKRVRDRRRQPEDRRPRHRRCRRSRTRKELEAAVRFQAQDELPMPLDQAVIDYQPLGVVETPDGPRQRVAARRGPPRHDRAPRSTRPAPPACAPRASTSPPSPWSARCRAAVEDEPRCSTSPSAASRTSRSRRARTASSPASSAAASRRMAVELAERQRPDAGPRPRLAAPRRPRRRRSRRSRATRRSSPTRAPCCPTASRRIAAEVRNSLDFHHDPGRHGRRSVARVVLTGPAVAVPGFADAPRARARPARRARRRRRRAGDVDASAADHRRRPGRRGGRGMKAVNLIPVEERRAPAAAGRTGGAAYVLLGVLAIARRDGSRATLTAARSSDKRARASTQPRARRPTRARGAGDSLRPTPSSRSCASQRDRDRQDPRRRAASTGPRARARSPATMPGRTSR